MGFCLPDLNNRKGIECYVSFTGNFIGNRAGNHGISPCHSFGHLAAIENAMGITRNTAVLFEVLLHVGTLAAIFFCIS